MMRYSIGRREATTAVPGSRAIRPEAFDPAEFLDRQLLTIQGTARRVRARLGTRKAPEHRVSLELSERNFLSLIVLGPHAGDYYLVKAGSEQGRLAASGLYSFISRNSPEQQRTRYENDDNHTEFMNDRCPLD